MRPKRFVAVFLMSLFGLLSGCSKTTQWNEEVQLQSGEVIQTHRTQTGHKTGGGFTVAGWKNEGMTLEIAAPVKPDNPKTWSQKLVPMVLDRDPANGEWFVVATFDSCTEWYELGRPKSPYIEYRFRNGQWVQQTLTPAFIGREANMLTHLRASGEPVHTLESKRGSMSHPKLPSRYKSILAKWETNC